MSDLISRQAAIEAIDYVNEWEVIGITVVDKDDVIRQINVLPTIEERKTGTWTVGADMPPMKHRNGKPKKFWPSLRYCSVCGHEAFDDSDWGEQLFDWCPYCGADMRGDADG